MRYYVYAFLYVIFAVDAVFLFPWAVVFAAIGWQAAVEMGVFVGFSPSVWSTPGARGCCTWT